MGTWTTEVWLAGMPEEILELMTEPDAIARWSPVPFEVLELDGERLRAGSRARVRGSLAGRPLEFDVRIIEADDRRLALAATGPIAIEAEYLVAPASPGSDVRASVSVWGHGFVGSLLARAVEALLAGGGLRASMARIGRELEPALAA